MNSSPISALWHPRQPLLEMALCVMFGIVLGDQLPGWGIAATAALSMAAAVYGAFQPRGRTQMLCFWLAAVMLGAALHGERTERSPARQLAMFVPEGGTAFSGSGVVDEKPVPGRARIAIRLEQAVIHGHPVPTGGRLLVQWPRAELPEYGDRVEFRGTITHLGRARNPGGFDTLAIRSRQGLYSLVQIRYTRDAEVIAHDQGHPFFSAALKCREKMEQAMALGLSASPEVVTVVQSIVLGTQADASEELLDLFRHTGTIHLFSVSGLHVAMLAAMFFTLLRLLGLPRRGVALLVIPVLWAYCFITGLAPGSLRATLMGTVAMLGIALERPALSWNALGAAALAIVLVDSDQLFRPGFQLSFLLVAALLAGAEPTHRLLLPWVQPDAYLPRALWNPRQVAIAWAGGHTMAAVAVSLVAWIAAIPVTLWYFNLWSPSTLPANLIAVLLSWFILALGLASGLIGTFWSGLALLLNQLNLLFTKALLGALAFFAAIPGGHRFVEWPRWQEQPLCELESLDLAGGGAVFLRLRTGGGTRDWLIDCGGANQFRWTLLPYLRARGVNRLEGVILTHGDSRHVGGTLPLMEQIPVGEVIDSPRRDRSSSRRALQRHLEQHGVGRSIVQFGDRITLGPGAELQILHPPAVTSLPLADDKALVFRLDLSLSDGHRKRILFTSDAGFPTFQSLLQQPEELRADVWLKGLHARDNLGATELDRTVGAQAVVVASAPFPKAQRPDAEWIAAVENRGAKLFLQHEAGAVRIAIFADGRIEASSYAGETFRSRSR